MISKSSLVFLILFITGCASAYHHSDFLPASIPLQSGKYFKQEYVAPGTDFRRYRKVKIEPVNLDYFENKSEFSQSRLSALTAVFQKDLQEQLGKVYQVLDADTSPDAETIIVRPALVKVGLSYQVLEVQNESFGGPVAFGASVFEAKLIDGSSGAAIAFIAEKRTSKGPRQPAGFSTNYPHAEITFRKWANRLREMVQSYHV